MSESVKWWCRRGAIHASLRGVRSICRRGRWCLYHCRVGQVRWWRLILRVLYLRLTGATGFVFLMVNLLRKHAEGYALPKTDKKGFVSNSGDQYIPRWECSVTWLSGRGPGIAHGVAKGVYKMLGSVKKSTRSYHPQTNCMERLKHTMCQMMSNW